MYLIVGCGLSGAVMAERIANALEEKVLVIDRRNHIAGNIYDYDDQDGIKIHQYGPHAFHTQSKRVWDYLSRFTDWHIYFHRVKAFIDGQKVPVPFNFNSLYSLFPEGFSKRLESALVQEFGFDKRVSIQQLTESNNEDIVFLANYIYRKVYLGYTVKQWGVRPEELDKSVAGRVPICTSRDDRYFQDTYQGIPKLGYTAMVEKMLDNDLIDIRLNTQFDDLEDVTKFKKIVYTGPIDEFYNFQFGELPYRSLNFKLETLSLEYYQEGSQVNYPDNFDFTRITEFKYFLNQKSPRTTIAYEFPEDYRRAVNEAYYPILNDETQALYRKYRELSQKDSHVVFVGRLAEYRYYNMDQVVARALCEFENRF